MCVGALLQMSWGRPSACENWTSFAVISRAMLACARSCVEANGIGLLSILKYINRAGCTRQRKPAENSVCQSHLLTSILLVGLLSLLTACLLCGACMSAGSTPSEHSYCEIAWFGFAFLNLQGGCILWKYGTFLLLMFCSLGDI